MTDTDWSQKLELIDVHHHVVLPAYEQALIKSGARDPSKPLRKNATPAEILEAMGRFGIARAVVNPLSAAGVHHGDDGRADYLVASTTEALAKFAGEVPDRLGFFAPLSYPDVTRALRQLEYALDTLHADGVILMTNQNGAYVGDKAGEELWAEMDRRGAAVFIHPTRPANHEALGLDIWAAVIEYPFETTRVAANLIYNGFMARYPNIKWILAHAGGCLPYLSLRLKLMEEQDEHTPAFSERHPEGTAPYIGRFYYDTAIAGSRAAMGALQEVAGPGQILFGSDWPYITAHFVTEQLENMTAEGVFTPENFTAMEQGNAKRIFTRFG
ncbi:MAG: hypothetical protein RLZ98_2826 [Pseudomonadota bacterium]